MEKAIEALRKGGIIIYPSDTIWAIGCDATNDAACERIKTLTAKQEGMILLADGFPMVERYIPDFLEICYDLVDFATKPISLIYPNAKDLSPFVLGKDTSAGFRITTNPICLKLIRSIRMPLVATTMPMESGKIARRFEDIPESILQAVDVVMEERQNEKMQPLSQIIKIGLNSSVKVLRK